MITYLGSVSLAGALPLFATSLATMKGTLVQALADLVADAASLRADLAALEGDAAALASDLGDVKGLAEGMLNQLASGPTAIVRGIEAAIASLLDGSQLLALKQALLGGPAAVLASLQAALAEVQAKVASFEARIRALTARITALGARIAALVARIAALEELLARLLAWQTLLGTAGVHLVHYVGPVGSFASEFSAEFGNGGPGGGSPSDLANALVLLTTATDPWIAMRKVFKVIV